MNIFKEIYNFVTITLFNLEGIEGLTVADTQMIKLVGLATTIFLTLLFLMITYNFVKWIFYTICRVDR